LVLAFTCVAVAFLGLGLLLAMLAPTVPAVQALGQCVFLPLLIIGGIAVPLASLPDWAQRVAAFFPGRYAVDALQATVTGPGLHAARFSVVALLAIGAAAGVAATQLFRWDAQQRLAPARGVGWVGAALAAWVAVGLVSVQRQPTPPQSATAAAAAANSTKPVVTTPRPVSPPPAQPVTTMTAAEERVLARRKAAAPPPSAPPPRPTSKETVPAPTPSSAALTPFPESWQAVTRADIDRDLAFAELPPDAGIVTPVAESGEQLDPDQADLLEHIRRTLPAWKPARVDDPVQRARNYLIVAGVGDIQQLTLERHLPLVVFDRLRADVPRDDLIKVLYWIATRPDEGSMDAIDEVGALRLDADRTLDVEEVRNRVAIYAAKLLWRLIR
jgi:hypothetical protein